MPCVYTAIIICAEYQEIRLYICALKPLHVLKWTRIDIYKNKYLFNYLFIDVGI